MMDYDELIKALRGCTPEKYCEDKACKTFMEGRVGFCRDCLMKAAADAIEALQAAEPTERQVVDYCNKRCLVVLSADLFHELKASYGKLPKRGEWIEDTTTYAGPGLSNYKCSLCGKICGTWRSGLEPSELPNWCGNCGADMRKMEVQE